MTVLLLCGLMVGWIVGYTYIATKVYERVKETAEESEVGHHLAIFMGLLWPVTVPGMVLIFVVLIFYFPVEYFGRLLGKLFRY